MNGFSELDAEGAVAHVARGGLIAFPTETSWGLAADARSPEAVDSLRRFKARDDKPLSVLVEDGQAGRLLVPEAESKMDELAERFWPGPLTLVVGQAKGLAPGVAREDGSLGLRCSPHPDAMKLARAAAAQGVGPLTATSLNLSGEPATLTREAARALCAKRGGAVLLQGGECGGEAGSTVLDCTTDPPTVLREGALPRAQLEALLGPLGVAPTESTSTP